MQKDITTIAAGTVAAGIVLFILSKIYKNQQARNEQDHALLDVGGMLTEGNAWAGAGDLVQHYLHPNAFTGPATVLPVRYPSISGVNLSVIAQHGFEPLFRARPTDYDYLVAPPGNEG